jgi:hypothetical protein
MYRGLRTLSSEANKKTLELLAIKHPDHLDVNEGVVTNKKGDSPFSIIFS